MPQPIVGVLSVQRVGPQLQAPPHSFPAVTAGIESIYFMAPPEYMAL